MIEKPKRPKRPDIQDRQPPRTLQELISRYDLDNNKVYEFLDELIDVLNNKILVVEEYITESITVPANYNKKPIDISIKKTGYVPLGIVEVDTSNNNTAIGKFSFNNNTAYINIINPQNTSQSTTVTIKVLYFIGGNNGT